MLRFLPFSVLVALFLALAGCGDNSESASQNHQLVQDSIRLARERDSIAAAQAARKPKTVQQALREDARLARTMPVAQFARHMKAKESYYRQFKDVKYEDEFVKIKFEDNKWKIETPDGKAKFEEDGYKIKTDTYTRKVEKE